MILGLTLLVFAGAGAGPAPAAAQTPLQQTFWALVVNDVPKGDVLAVLEGADTWIPVASLDDAGLRGFGGDRRTLFNHPYVRLDSLAPDIAYRRDLTDIVLRLIAAPHLFDTSVVVLQRDRPEGISYASTAAVYSNYSVTWDEQAGTSGYGESGISLFGNTAIGSFYSVDADGVFSRGLSSMAIDRPSRRLRFEFGDTVAQPTPLGSAPILGGVSIGRDYALDPYYYRYPTPFIRGTAQSPSDVEIYVNGSLARRLQVGTGPYRLDRLPVNTGLGNVRVVVRDPFGRQQEINLALYQPSGLLRRGEHDFQFVGGKLRDDTTAQPTYGDWQGTAFQRVGVSNWLTAGYSVEGSGDVVAGGPTASMRLGRLGEMEFNAWKSRTADKTDGFAAYGVYTFIAPFLNITATGQYYDDGFANLFVAPGRTRTPEFVQLSGGVPIWSLGSITYLWEHRKEPAGNLGFTRPDGSFDDETIQSRAHTLQLTMRLLLGIQFTSQLTLTEARDQQRWTGFAGINVAFGRSATTMSATYSKPLDTENTFIDINKSLPLGRGVGYRVTSSDVDGGTAGGLFEVNTGLNRMRVSYDATDGGDTKYAAATMSGGISGTRAGLYFTRPLDASAAVVEVKGLKGVGILVDNTFVGRTGRSGKLLVNEMLPYLANRISYVEKDIPFDYTVPVPWKLAAPPFRGAAYVKFDTSRIQGRRGTVVLMIDGAPVVPRYGLISVAVAGVSVESPLNEDGHFFLDLPDGRHTATVTFKGSRCDVEFEATTGKDLVQNVGTLACTP